MTTFGTKLGQIVSSANGVVVFRQDVVQPGLVLHEVLHAGPVLQRPLHVGDQAGEWVALSFAPDQHLLDQGEHPLLIEVAVPQIGILPGTNVRAARAARRGRVDARRLQPPSVFGAVPGINDVVALVAVVETFLDEGQENVVLLVLAVEEGTDMAGAVENRPGQVYRLVVASMIPPQQRARNQSRDELTQYDC